MQEIVASVDVVFLYQLELMNITNLRKPKFGTLYVNMSLKHSATLTCCLSQTVPVCRSERKIHAVFHLTIAITETRVLT